MATYGIEHQGGMLMTWAEGGSTRFEASTRQIFDMTHAEAQADSPYD